ncbi:MAG: hypothetical protein C4289_00560 [Chloroflexota bacterium]
MLPDLRRYILENWTRVTGDKLAPRDVTILVQGTGAGKLCCYIFPAGARRPALVAKVPRSPRDNPLLAREYGLIQYLRSRGSPYLQATLPAPLVMTAVAGHLVVIEIYLPGQVVDGLLARNRQTGTSPLRDVYLKLAADWLLRSQAETASSPTRLTEAQFDTFILRPLTELRTTAHLTESETRYLERLAQRARELARLELPLVFRHGDLRPGNLLVSHGMLKVVDWENGAPVGLPLLDLFGLLARMHARHYGLEEIDDYLEDYCAAFEDVFFDGGSFAETTLRYVKLGCHVLGVHPAWVDVLFGMFLVMESNNYFHFLRQRVEHGYVYLLRSRDGTVRGPLSAQLARQKYVWLIGHLAQNEERLVFHRLGQVAQRQHWTAPMCR